MGSSGNGEDRIELVVPTAPGGGFDEYARIMKPYWEEELGEEVVVNNIEGAGGAVGASEVAEAEPDGQTIMHWDTGQGPLMQVGGAVDFDQREFSIIGSLTRDPNCLIVHNDAGINDWDEFIDSVSELTFGSNGAGGGYHIYTLLLGLLTGEFQPEEADFVHYEGTGDLVAAFERGEIDAAIPGTTMSGAKLALATDAEILAVFGDDELIHEYLDETYVPEKGNPPEYFLSDLSDLDNIEEYSDLTSIHRNFSGPPNIPDETLSRQREGFNAILDNEEFPEEARENGRWIVNPGTIEDVQNDLEARYEAFSQDPIESILQEAYGN